MSPKKRRRGSGEGAIYQKADGRWCAAVDLGVVDGKRARKYVYGKTRKEVADKLKQLHVQQEQGVTLHSSDRQTVAGHLAYYLAHVVKPKNRPSTHETYTTLVAGHIAPAIGHIKLRQLTAQRCQELWNDLATRLAPRSVAVCRAILVGALELAYEYGDVARNVASATKGPPIIKHDAPATDQEKAKALLRAARGDGFEALYHTALETGARIGELIGLRRQDVDTERRRLTIAGSTKSGVRGPTKNGEPRTVAISPQLTERLRVVLGGHAHEPLWPRPDGRPADDGTVRYHFKAVLKHAGLPNMRFHDLRHWAASLMLASGIAPGVVKERLGHSTFAITMDVYGHLVKEVEDKAAETMGKLLEENADEGDEETT